MKYKYFFILYIINVVAVPLDSIVLKENQRIAFFIGSFDPLHLGHDQSMNLALKAAQLDYVIIIPDHSYSSHKPNRISLAIRQEMVDAAYKNNPNILTTHDSIDQCLSRIKNLNFENLAIMAIIRSEYIWDQKSLQDFIPPTWLMLTRDQDYFKPEYQQLTHLLGAPVTKIIEPSPISISSTRIRELINKKEKLPDNVICPEVLNIIKKI